MGILRSPALDLYSGRGYWAGSEVWVDVDGEERLGA